MKLLVLNAGSSSVKYSLFEDESPLTSGIVEKIGHDDSNYSWSSGDETTEEKIPIADHHGAVELILKKLVEQNIIGSLSDISAVGHRVVHGGEFFKEAVKIDSSVTDSIRKCIPLAPLHNPHNLAGIEACDKLLDGTPMVAVFDTAFHQTLPQHAFMYPLPYELYKEKSVRRYGFHGTSHSFVANKAAEALGRPLEELKLITLHLGNGSSACAISGGKSIDTSMGFTPLEGLMMGTRCGTIDPAIPLFLIRDGMSADDVDKLMNKKSGLLGISGKSNDMRDLYTTDDERAWLAIDMFCYNVVKTIGSYIAALGGCDAIVFTAGIGEHVTVARERISKGLVAFGIELDEEANNKVAPRISTESSKIPLLVIHTDEELMIARQTQGVLG